MKIRTHFVSNSSSSSFTCCISGEEYSGWDASLSDCEMVASHYGTYREEYLLKPLDEIQEEYKQTAAHKEYADKYYGGDLDKAMDDYRYDLRGEIPKEYCPLYNLKYITNYTILTYLLYKNQTSRETLEEEIRKNFQNLQELLDAAAKKD